MNVKQPETASAAGLTDPSCTREGQTKAGASAARSVGPRTLDSRELLGDQVMVLIRHLGEIYRLQTTRQGKLILTK